MQGGNGINLGEGATGRPRTKRQPADERERKGLAPSGTCLLAKLPARFREEKSRGGSSSRQKGIMNKEDSLCRQFLAGFSSAFP